MKKFGLFIVLTQFTLGMAGFQSHAQDEAQSQSSTPDWREMVAGVEPIVVPGGSPGGSVPTYEAPAPTYESLDRWRGNALDILKRHGKAAADDRNLGLHDDAITRLITGLQKAHESRPDWNRMPFTARAIGRGINMALQIGAAVKDEPNGPATMLRFLFNYYSFVQNVAEQLDRRPYLTSISRDRRDRYDPYGDREFEEKFIAYIRMQINIVLDVLVLRSRDEYGPEFISAGSPYAYLNAMTIVTQSASWDLRETNLDRYYGRVIDDLEFLNLRIRTNDYANSELAVDSSYIEARRIGSELRGSWTYSDPETYYQGQWITFTCPGSYFWLSDGDTQSVRFKEMKHVKNIYVKAEAYRVAARVEVFVNGELRGEMVIPAYDPSYFLPIERDTHSIEFRHVSGGSVRIYSVNAVTRSAHGDHHRR